MKPICATYAGRCALCDEQIEEDDLIVSVEGEWAHAECAEPEGEEVEW